MLLPLGLIHCVELIELEKEKGRVREEQKVGWEGIWDVAVVIWYSPRGGAEFLVHNTTSLPLGGQRQRISLRRNREQ